MVAAFSGSVTVNALPPPPGDGLSVTLTRADTGGVTTYTQSESTTLGSYVDPEGGWTQQCFLAPMKSTFPGMRVWFRPDATSARQEIIFEYGDPTSLGGTQAAATNSPGYTARVYDGTTLLYTSPAIPVHYWLARWRWNPTPRPIRKTPAQLIATGVLPNFSIPSDISSFTPNRPPQTYTIMGRAGMVQAMGGTSDRPDIGLITDWGANWLMRGVIADTVLAQGEAIGSADMFMRNPTTHSLLDLESPAYDQASMYTPQSSGGGNPFIPRTSPYAFAWDLGHNPQCAVLPYMMTGDVYYLEHLQGIINRSLLSQSVSGRYGSGARYFAWPLRDALYAEKVTPTTVPGWILPKSVFTAYVVQYRNKVVADMALTTPDITVFRFRGYPTPHEPPMFPNPMSAAAWQESFEVAVYALAVQHGHTEWIPQVEWKGVGEIARTNGTSGWYRSTPNPYRLMIAYAANLAVAITSSTTTFQMDEFADDPWPAVPFDCRITTGGGSEVVRVTAKVGRTWTVTRDISGTPKATNAIGDSLVTVNLMTSWAEAGARTRGPYPDSHFGFNPSDPTGNALLRKGNVGYYSYFMASLGILTSIDCSISSQAETCYDWIRGQYNILKEPGWTPFFNWDIKKTPPV